MKTGISVTIRVFKYTARHEAAKIRIYKIKETSYAYPHARLKIIPEAEYELLHECSLQPLWESVDRAKKISSKDERGLYRFKFNDENAPFMISRYAWTLVKASGRERKIRPNMFSGKVMSVHIGRTGDLAAEDANSVHKGVILKTPPVSPSKPKSSTTKPYKLPKITAKITSKEMDQFPVKSKASEKKPVFTITQLMKRKATNEEN